MVSPSVASPSGIYFTSKRDITGLTSLGQYISYLLGIHSIYKRPLQILVVHYLPSI